MPQVAESLAGWAAIVLLLALASMRWAIGSDRPALSLRADLGLHAMAFAGFGLFAYLRYRQDDPVHGLAYLGPAAAAVFLFSRTLVIAAHHVAQRSARRRARQQDHATPVAFYTPDMAPASYQVEPPRKPMSRRARLIRMLVAPALFALWMGEDARPDQILALAIIGLMYVAGEAVGYWQLRRLPAPAGSPHPEEARSWPGPWGSGR